MIKKLLIAAILIIVCATLFFLAKELLLPKEIIVYDQANKTFVVKGDVKIKKAGEGSQWQKLEPSTVLEKGDMIETAEDSTADIVIGKDTDKALKIDEKTRLEFKEINPASLDLPRGKVMVMLKKLEPKSSFVIKTPTAVCGARGTAWSTQASESGTTICVFENSVFVQKVDARGNPELWKHTADEGTQRIVAKDKPMSGPQRIGQEDMDDWLYWNKNITFLADGKVLINDFNQKENFNNLGGPFGSWVVFYSDQNQYCRDEFTPFERMGDSGFGLKVSYDVDSPFSAYNGFFTKLIGIDLTGYKYLVFHIKGDRGAGFTTKLDVELKNKFEIGRIQVKGLTDQWQKIVLPLEKFTGIKDFRDMKEIVILFSDINVTRKEGVVYIDDIYFTKEDPGQMRNKEIAVTTDSPS